MLSFSEHLLCLKRFSKKKVKQLGKEEQVLKEKNLMKSLKASGWSPQVLSTCMDSTHAGILLNTSLACSLASILHKPLDDSSARFCAASIIIALEQLHKVVLILVKTFLFCFVFLTLCFEISEWYSLQRCIARCYYVGSSRTFTGSCFIVLRS